MHIHIVGHTATLLHHTRHHANGGATRLVRGARHTLHQSHIATSEDQLMAFAANPLAQLLRRTEEIGVDMLIG